MLELQNITKEYPLGEQTVHALKGINLRFAKKGLVAVLGPSGCGKTTLMNIVGGLDRATSGDLIIDGISTKSYSEKDWNNYRNHRIGFVFQAYNLIPHMSVLSNVELALTLSGVSAKERKQRVLAALKEVDLSDQANKKPNQMSGGQMQRVAIARALVNNPKILIADEPTGAVDTQTGIQIMEILKEVSKTCLVILVTHNKELAKTYADRTINMRDGLIQSDNQNLVDDDIKYEKKYKVISEETKKKRVRTKSKREKTKMHLATSTKLSFRNLLNKKWRSLTTIISGAISVICIALILAMNSGFSYYIKEYEKSNLSRYPIKVSTQNTDIADLLTEALAQGRNFDKSNVDFASMLSMFKDDEELREKYTDVELVYLSKLILAIIETGISGFQNMKDFDSKGDPLEALSALFGINLGSDIIEFKRAIEKDFNPEWGAVMYNYDINFDIYSEQLTGKQIKLNPVDMFIEFIEKSGLVDIARSFSVELESDVNSMLYGEDMRQIKEMFDKSNPWSMMIDNKDLLELHYDILAGRLPAFGTDSSKNEIVLVVDKYNQLDDFTMFLLGVISVESFLVTVINQMRPLLGSTDESLIDFAIALLLGPNVEEVKMEYDFETFIGAEGKDPATFTLRVPTDYYDLDEETGIYNKMGEGVEVKVVGILRLKPDVNASVISGAIGYTEALAKELITRGNEAPVLTALDNALEEHKQAKNSLVNTIKGIISLDFNMDVLSSISIPERLNLLIEILSLSSNIEISQERVSLIIEVASLLEGFEFTPENQVVLEEIIEQLSSFEITEENYAIFVEVISLLEEIDLSEENLALALEMLDLIQQLNLGEDNVVALGAAASLLSELELSEENMESLQDVVLLLRQIDPESHNLSILAEVGINLSEIALTPERAEGLMEILDVLRKIDWETDGPILLEVFETIALLINNPTDTSLLGHLSDLIGTLSTANAEIIWEVIPLVFDLGLSASELMLVWDALQLLSGLDLESSEVEILQDVITTLGEMELSDSDKEVLLEVLDKLRDINIDRENITVLVEIINIIMDIELSERDSELLTEAVNLMAGIEITEDDRIVLTEIINSMRELDFSSEDMLILRQAAGLIEALGLTQEEISTLWEMISIVEELDLTSEDIDRLNQILTLAEEINFSEKEQMHLESLFGTLGAFDLKDSDSLLSMLNTIRQVELSNTQVDILWEILESLMFFVGFENEVVGAILDLVQSVIALNLSDTDIDILVELLPKFLEMDFSKISSIEEKDILKQIGDIFKIRNIVVSEDKDCFHAPDEPHTINCAWFDVAQFDSLISSFKLKDLMRPNDIEIYSYSIESRNEVLNFLNTYNKGISANQELAASTIDYSIIYSDELSEITTSMSSMINTITYMLIAVAAVAVIVAMLLVAIILYISIQDRTKEIGLLRSLGASKGNISSLFIAETLIIGLVSGFVGVIIALILTFPANLIIGSVLGISNLLRPIWWHQFALIGIALIITIISGLIPATLAAKKDPVLALRIE